MKIGLAALFILVLAGGYFVFNKQKPVNDAPTATPTGKSESTDSAQTKSYTLEVVATHNIETDCWLVIEGKVYDVTKFIPVHPGGKAIIKGCGKDATTLFQTRPTKGLGAHPDQAKEKLPEFYIGDIIK